MMSQAPASAKATRFTLTAAPGLKASHFTLGLMVLMAGRSAELGQQYSARELAKDSGVHRNTINKLLRRGSAFEAETLANLAGAFGRYRWEDVSVLGQRVALLINPTEDTRHDQKG